MATTRFYLDMRGKAGDGKGSILISLYHNFSTAVFSTGIRIAPDNWKRERVVGLPDSQALNIKLNENKNEIDKAIAFHAFDENFEHLTATQLKHLISDGTEKKSRGHLLKDVFAEYISFGNLKETTKTNYKSTLSRIEDFAGDSIRLEDINLKWLRGFDSFLAKTNKVNTKATYLKCLRAVCNYAKKARIVSVYPFEFFELKYEQTANRNISIDDFIRFITLPISERDTMYRDYFLLSFYLIGINMIDLLLAKKTQVSDGRLDYIRSKTSKKYSVKIEPEAEALLKKYAGKGEYLLDAMDHCMHYRSFARLINKHISSFGIKEKILVEDTLFGQQVEAYETKPLISDLTSYFARHTWSTLAYNINIPIDVIAQALGHSMHNKTTLIYIKPDQSKVDWANRKVLDYLKELIPRV